MCVASMKDRRDSLLLAHSMGSTDALGNLQQLSSNVTSKQLE